MNEVFLEGITAAIDQLTHQTTTSHHLIIRLQTTHRNRQGERKHEVYTVNAWNRLADWTEKHLAVGAPVLVRGYLTQQTHGGVTATEITASQFVIRQATPCGEEIPADPPAE